MEIIKSFKLGDIEFFQDIPESTIFFLEDGDDLFIKVSENQAVFISRKEKIYFNRYDKVVVAENII